MSARNVANIVAVIGTTGSGKSRWTKEQLAASKRRRLIWDPQAEYGEFGQVFTAYGPLLDYVSENPRDFRAVYQPGDAISKYPARFAFICQLAYTLGDLLLVIEELADVTEPSRAPDSWSVICRKGRHKGLSVVALSQRPADVDKDFFGNCTMIHCCGLNYENDLKVMAAVLGVKPAEVGALQRGPDRWDWIERNMGTGAIRRGCFKREPT